MKPLESILVIDDNQETLETLGSLFAALGVRRVKTTECAEDALDILKNEHFSIVVSDYWMAGMDGVAMVEALRARGDTTPVLLLSGVPDVSAVLKALHQPKVAFFGKPFRIEDITEAMENLQAA